MFHNPLSAAVTAMSEAMDVGIATGLVMPRSQVSPREAEDLLAAAAERCGKTLVETARSYIDTGQT